MSDSREENHVTFNCNAISCLDRALLSARCLANLITSSGKFIYKYDLSTGDPLPGYNILRHSGCVWAINRSDSVATLGPKVQKAARLAMEWLIGNRVIRAGRSGLAVADRETLKLGANGLAVLALVSLPDFSTKDKRVVSGLCKYMRAQHREDGHFVHQRNLLTGSIKPFQSQYYTGEALFAMLVASEQLSDYKQFEWSQGVLKTLVAKGYGIAEQSHWMMYAVETCYRISPDPELLLYAERLAEAILENPDYRATQSCTPIACRNEALLASLRLPLTRVSPSRLLKIWNTVKVNLSLQLRDYLPGGAFRKGHGSNQVRIDYLQHNLLTLLDFSQILHHAP
jgi:hypothetical protein